MGTHVINGELTVSFPDGFHEMDATEQKKVFLGDAPNRWAIWDTQAHIILCITWHVSGKLLSKLASERDVLERTRKQVRKSYKTNPYREYEGFSTQVCGQRACGFAFDHVIEGVSQGAEIIVFKHGTSCYTVSYFSRKENESANHVVFEGILNSMHLA